MKTIAITVEVTNDDGCKVETVVRKWEAAVENKDWIIEKINEAVSETVEE